MTPPTQSGAADDDREAVDDLSDSDIDDDEPRTQSGRTSSAAGKVGGGAKRGGRVSRSQGRGMHAHRADGPLLSPGTRGESTKAKAHFLSVAQSSGFSCTAPHDGELNAYSSFPHSLQTCGEPLHAAVQAVKLPVLLSRRRIHGAPRREFRKACSAEKLNLSTITRPKLCLCLACWHTCATHLRSRVHTIAHPSLISHLLQGDEKNLELHQRERPAQGEGQDNLG